MALFTNNTHVISMFELVLSHLIKSNRPSRLKLIIFNWKLDVLKIIFFRVKAECCSFYVLFYSYNFHI